MGIRESLVVRGRGIGASLLSPLGHPHPEHLREGGGAELHAGDSLRVPSAIIHFCAVLMKFVGDVISCRITFWTMK